MNYESAALTAELQAQPYRNILHRKELAGRPRIEGNTLFCVGASFGASWSL